MQQSPFPDNELWDIAHRLVSFDTISAHPNSEAASFLANYLQNCGFTVHTLVEEIDTVQKVMVIAWIGPEVPGGLIICGHIDTVPFEGQPGWRTNPLEMTLVGEQIVGRGVSDMKVFLAQALLAARHLDRRQLSSPLVYLLTCDEELAGPEGQGSQRMVDVLPRYIDRSWLPTVALIGEPSSNQIFHTHKGYTTFTVRVRGKGGHSSVPQLGVNAIDVMADVLRIVGEQGRRLAEEVSAENRLRFPESPASTFNVGLIQGGLAPNMIADTCQATISIRVTPGDSAGELIAAIQHQAEAEVERRIKAISPDCAIEFEHLLSVPPLLSPEQGAFVTLLSEVYGEQTLRSAPFATDGGQLQRLGINSYICGPGLLEQAHQPNESLPLSHFLSNTARIERIIQQWCTEKR